MISKSSNSLEERSPDRLEYKGAKGEDWQVQGEVSFGEGTEASCFLKSRVFSSAGSTLKHPMRLEPRFLVKALASSQPKIVRAP